MTNERQMPGLKPCPFCPDGGDPTIIKGFQAFNDCEIQCLKCFISGPGCAEHGDTDEAYELNKADATKHWNTRSDLSEWRPIETAPKDGAQFLGYIPELGYKNDRGKLQGCNVHVCWYGHSYSENKDRFHIYAIGAFAEEIIPTHWMPLPPHPKDDE
jgi:hypothetical protein